MPTTNGGTWALGEGHLLHATIDDSGAYCLASVDLASRAAERRLVRAEAAGLQQRPRSAPPATRC